MNKNITFALLAVFALVFISGIANALVISSVNSENIAPGQEARLDVYVKNNLNYDVEDVSLTLDFSSVALSAVDSSSVTVNEIQEGDKEDFGFIVRADSNAKAMDYKVPYILVSTYKNTSSVDKGTISIRVAANPEISFSSSVQNPIVGQKGKITLKIINKGLGDAKFVSVSLNPDKYSLLSDSDVYIGTISADDFDTASFDVIFNAKNPTLSATVEYRDMDNSKSTKIVDLPLNVYTKDEAIKQGIIAKSNSIMYLLVIIILLVIWFIWRTIRKRNRLKKSQAVMNSNRS